jgi:signal transduction histidine kinase
LIILACVVSALGVHLRRGSLVNVLLSLLALSTLLLVREWTLRRVEARRLQSGALLMIALVLPFVTMRALLNGQSRSVIVWATSVVPVLTAYLVGVRWAIRMAVVSIACLALIYFGESYAPSYTKTVQSQEALVLGQVALVATLTGLFATQRRVVDRQIAEVEAKHQLIQQQAEALRLQTIELAEARDAALAADRLKGQFLATVSHELRTPLNGVIGMTQVLLTTPLAPEQRDFVSTVRMSGESLLALVNDLLDLSKLEARKVTLELLPFNLWQWARQTLAIVGPQTRAKGLQLSLDIAADVPHAVIADPLRLRQILLNLVANATKFTDRGEIDVRLALEGPATAEMDGPVTVHCSVRDTGIGIPSELVDRLFQAFNQIDPSIARRYGGTGRPVLRDC